MKSKEITLPRSLPTSLCRILNMQEHGCPEGAVYVGRKNTIPHFGNPFTHKKTEIKGQSMMSVHTQAEAVQCFEMWLLGTGFNNLAQTRRRWILTNIHTLYEKDLVCWCPTGPCHAEVLARYAQFAYAWREAKRKEINNAIQRDRRSTSVKKSV